MSDPIAHVDVEADVVVDAEGDDKKVAVPNEEHVEVAGVNVIDGHGEGGIIEINDRDGVDE